MKKIFYLQKNNLFFAIIITYANLSHNYLTIKTTMKSF